MTDTDTHRLELTWNLYVLSTRTWGGGFNAREIGNREDEESENEDVVSEMGEVLGPSLILGLRRRHRFSRDAGLLRRRLP
jgi:hypothetical protein